MRPNPHWTVPVPSASLIPNSSSSSLRHWSLPEIARHGRRHGMVGGTRIFHGDCFLPFFFFPFLFAFSALLDNFFLACSPKWRCEKSWDFLSSYWKKLNLSVLIFVLLAELLHLCCISSSSRFCRSCFFLFFWNPCCLIKLVLLGIGFKFRCDISALKLG